jgi:serine/threonine protein kinase
MIGETIAHYRITAKLGEGGMGEVYRATDTKLGREVALKILPEAFARDADRMARFEQEAKVLASLNHPNIATIHGVEERALVMELVEGTPLKGPLPLEKAIEYAGQILDALDAAHQKGITHRDLKPANILVTKQGIKLLDFGLAKQTAPLKETDGTRALTGQGQILGTLQYMAPEQLQGKEVDARSDLFSFGCVLYEMLSGERAFEGQSPASVIAAILEREPAKLALAPPLERVIRTCLEKDPEQRFQTARDLKRALLWATEPQPNDIAVRRVSRWPLMAVAAALVLGAGAFITVRSSRAPSAGELVRFSVCPPPGLTFVGTSTTSVHIPQFAVSPDGTALAFVAAAPGSRPMLWLRPIAEVTAHPLEGTENVEYPFWSPDSRWLGFFAAGKLKKIPAASGPAQVLADGFPVARGGSWQSDDTILFADSLGPFYRIRSTGGSIAPLPKLDVFRQEGSPRFPYFLPDGRHFLFTLFSGSEDRRGIYAGALDGGGKKLLDRINSNALYAQGYLLRANGDVLIGQAFDTERLELTGQPFTITEGIGRGGAGDAAVSVSRNSTLAYAGVLQQPGRLTWFDRNGNALGSTGAEGDYLNFRLSPDEKRLAVALVDPKTGGADTWITDLARGSTSRFTFGPAINSGPIWSPDASEIVYRTNRRGIVEFYAKSANAAGKERPVLLEDVALASRLSITGIATDWSPDGRIILFAAVTASFGYDLWVVPPSGQNPVKFLASPADEMLANFSPDGRLVAYTSNESGRYEVYVQTFPVSDRKWQVSTNGGYEPRWRGDGREVYYLSDDRKLIAVPVGAGPAFGVPKPLFQTQVPEVVNAMRSNYVPTRDGQRFLINTHNRDAAPTPITVVLNWQAGLKK